MPSTPYLWFLTIILFLCSLSLQAQTDPPPPPDGGGGPGGVDDVPIHQFVVVVFVVGVVYGIKKLKI